MVEKREGIVRGTVGSPTIMYLYNIQDVIQY